MKKQAVALVGLTLGVGLVGVFIFLGGASAGIGRLEGTTDGQEDAVRSLAPFVGVATERAEVLSPGEPELSVEIVAPYEEGSVGLVMKDFYGDQWDEVRPHLESVDFSSDAVGAGYRPWHEARVHVLENLRQHVDLVAAVLELKVTQGSNVDAWASKMGSIIESGDYSDGHRDSLRSGLVDVQAEVQELVDQVRPAVEQYLSDVIEREGFRKRPLVGWSSTETQGKELIVGFVVAYGGWVVDLEADSAHFSYEQALIDTAMHSLSVFEAAVVE
jgi:hypothetical protein